LAVGALIAGTVGVLAQQSGVEQTPTGLDLYRSEAARAAVADARGLSAAFRDVADAVLPAIVSIEAEGAARRVSIGDGEIPEEFFRNSPFGDDPRFRELFRRRQRGGTRMIPPRRSKGSGFVIDAREGIVLTNSHVVADADEVTVRLHDGRELVAEEVLTDPRTDVAVVRIEPDGLTEVPLGDSDSARIGDWVLAFGSPFGLDMSVTAGIVSAKGRGPGINDREDYIQTDAAVNPGNSGGPLVDLSGRVVGINTAISSRSGGYDGIAFAIPVRMAKWVADQLVDSGEVKRAYLGVAIQDIDGDLADEFGIEVPRGAIVTKIFDGSPAANAGLKVGDVIVRLNGREVTGPKKLQVVV
ncbi:MAG: trypsin-like peptidase domain-containing protein, partial [Planctomycetota bacterium]